MSDGNWMQESVREFMQMTGQDAPDKYTPLDYKTAKLRIGLIEEEATELAHALGSLANCDGSDELLLRKEAEAIKELMDLLYVVLGTAVAMGLPTSRFFAEVHRSNMTKKGGAIRADGKLLKPPGYQPARIAFLLERLKEQDV